MVTVKKRPVSKTAGEITAKREKIERRRVVEEEVGSALVEEQEFEEAPAEVRVGLGRTINTGDYSSVRVDVGVTLPCINTFENIYEAFNAAWQMVHKELEDKCADYDE